MKTVHKHELMIGATTLYLPPDHKVIHIGNQHENLCVWVELDPIAQTQPYDFRVFGTGHQIDEIAGMDILHVGTAIFQGGNFIAHVYKGSAQ